MCVCVHGKHEVVGSNPTRANFLYRIEKPKLKMNTIYIYIYIYKNKNDSNFNDFFILCGDNNGFRLLSKDSILISRDSPVLNKNTASVPLLLLLLLLLLFGELGYYLWYLVNFL